MKVIRKSMEWANSKKNPNHSLSLMKNKNKIIKRMNKKRTKEKIINNRTMNKIRAMIKILSLNS